MVIGMTVILEIADIYIEVTASVQIIDNLHKNASRFVSPYEKRCDIKLLIADCILINSRESFLSDYPYQEKETIVPFFYTYDPCIGWFDVESNVGYFYIDEEIKAIEKYSLVPIMRSLSVYLPLHTGVLFHGCAVAENNEATVFTGKSGSGKTTIAELTRNEFGCNLIGDDTIIIKIKNDGLHVYDTPFWDTLYPDASDVKCVKMALIFQAKTTSILKKNSVAAFETVLRNSFFVVPRESNSVMWKQLSNVCWQIASLLDFYVLYFEKNTTFWRMIKDETV